MLPQILCDTALRRVTIQFADTTGELCRCIQYAEHDDSNENSPRHIRTAFRNRKVSPRQNRNSQAKED
jgi:hypothetical protein